jgi:hypothetical protein
MVNDVPREQVRCVSVQAWGSRNYDDFRRFPRNGLGAPVLIDGVRTDTGVLVVPADFEVTTGFLERLTNFPASVTERLVRVRVYERPAAAAQRDRLQ